MTPLLLDPPEVRARSSMGRIIHVSARESAVECERHVLGGINDL